MQIVTDGVHADQRASDADRLSEEIKLRKAQVLLRVIDAHKMSQCIIFCRTKLDCDNLENFLNAVGRSSTTSRPTIVSGDHELSCTVVHGDRTQQERQANLERFKNGDARFLITTDVGARGLDISEIPFVISASAPSSLSHAFPISYMFSRTCVHMGETYRLHTTRHTRGLHSPSRTCRSCR